MSSTLVVQHLTVRCGAVAVVDDVSLEVKPLELHGLVGPTGAGKTTVLEALAGLVPSHGDVMLGPVPLDREARRHHIFYVADVAGDGDRAKIPFAEERVHDVMAFVATSMRVESQQDQVVDRLELHAVIERRMAELTRGERKRVMVALGLLVPEGFVLIDEPFEGLDLKEARALVNVLRTSTNEKRALLCAMQKLGDAERLCDKFTLLSKGRVVGAGPLHELRARAKAHPGAALEEVFVALT